MRNWTKMDSSVGSAIENIKRQEQNKEAKLKAQREFDAIKNALERSIKETIARNKKIEEEESDLIKKLDKLRSELTIQKLRRDALVAQQEASEAELKTLKTNLEKLKYELQELRAKYCDTVQEVADYCDVWALLMRPVVEEPLPRPVVKMEERESEKIALATKETCVYEERLRNAKERREKAKTERDRLLSEPDVGDEFVRHCKYQSNKLFSSNSKVEPNENEPIKFSTSPAASVRTVKPLMKKTTRDEPWYQPYSVIGSVAAFLIYFCVLREESDIDREFSRTLYERMEGLEKTQLLLAYKFNKEHGKSVTEIEQRLKELELEEMQANSKIE